MAKHRNAEILRLILIQNISLDKKEIRSYGEFYSKLWHIFNENLNWIIRILNSLDISDVDKNFLLFNL